MDSICKSHLTKCVGFVTILLMVAIPKCMDNVNMPFLHGEGGGAVYVSSLLFVVLCIEKKCLPWPSSSSNRYLCCLSLFQLCHVTVLRDTCHQNFSLSGPQCCVGDNAAKTKFSIFAYFQDMELM